METGCGERGAAPAPRRGAAPAPRPREKGLAAPSLLAISHPGFVTMRDVVPGHTLHGRPLVHGGIKLRARPSLHCNCTDDDALGARGSAGAHRALVHRGRPLGWAHVACVGKRKRVSVVPRRRPLAPQYHDREGVGRACRFLMPPRRPSAAAAAAAAAASRQPPAPSPQPPAARRPFPRATTSYMRPAEWPQPMHKCARDPALPRGYAWSFFVLPRAALGPDAASCSRCVVT
jgi:hypothetical protein